MLRNKTLVKLLFVFLVVVLAGGSLACGSSGAGVYVELPTAYDRWVTGDVYDYWTDEPIRGARVLVEDSYSDALYEGYTDRWGHFEIYVGTYFDYEDVYFRVYSIQAPWYYTYTADEYWYGVEDWDIIDTGDYLLE